MSIPDARERKLALKDIVPYAGRSADRAAWPPGPWDIEPDRNVWQDEITGMPCVVNRHFRFGHWCCYAAVSPGHPFYGMDYLDANQKKGFEHLTYSALGDDNHFWFGFTLDGPKGLMPGWPRETDSNKVYFTIQNARHLTAKLATALACVT